MTVSNILGGFKILKEVVWTSVSASDSDDSSLYEFCHLLAEAKINLPFLTWGDEFESRTIDFAVDVKEADSAQRLIDTHFSSNRVSSWGAGILSIFPHKSNPDILGSVLSVFSEKGIKPVALANSSSAISLVLKQEVVEEAATALFVPFNFSAYRTPSDWKLAQKGKEELYKEVVASYQEKKPKIYALEWRDDQKLICLRLKSRDMGILGSAFKDLARKNLALTFLISSLSNSSEDVTTLAFCLPPTVGCAYPDIIRTLPCSDGSDVISLPAGYFGMNGPHFGDRYGIARDLIKALSDQGIKLMGLSCSIHSITGIVPAPQIQPAIQAISKCFEVPSIISRNGT